MTLSRKSPMSHTKKEKPKKKAKCAACREEFEKQRPWQKVCSAECAANYVAIWNDESHWNKYLAEHPEKLRKVLTPSYVHPDSMIEEYYKKIWGRDFTPRLMTITKPFSLVKDDGSNYAALTSNL